VPLALLYIVRQQDGYVAAQVAAQVPVIGDWASRPLLTGLLGAIIH
jgi:hypothetical protein